MEERGAVEGPDKTHRWIVDPLDGTTNFLHGIPLFCIAIGAGARRRDGLPASSTIPILDELYTAEKGQGAFVNSRRLRVAARKIAGRLRDLHRHPASRPRRPRPLPAANARR